jgi:hypothetical protein
MPGKPGNVSHGHKDGITSLLSALQAIGSVDSKIKSFNCYLGLHNSLHSFNELKQQIRSAVNRNDFPIAVRVPHFYAAYRSPLVNHPPNINKAASALFKNCGNIIIFMWPA